ncbi:MAG: nucleotide exchange factor GrpE [Anaerolineae bacterium]|nr:nucleotide exchange factor GrpE [Anaerolineae bacterium]
MTLEDRKEETAVPVEVAEPAAEGEAEEKAEAVPQLEAAEDPLAALKAELEAARAQADEYLDQWRRSAAQFSNYKKRVEREQSEFTKLANAALISRLLPILDDFERAFETMPHNLSGLTWIEGLALIHRKLQMTLAQEGLEVIETEGQFFDPQFHEAVTYEDAEGFEEGQIIGELQKGYKLGERVLRPSMVRVAR